MSGAQIKVPIVFRGPNGAAAGVGTRYIAHYILHHTVHYMVHCMVHYMVHHMVHYMVHCIPQLTLRHWYR